MASNPAFAATPKVGKGLVSVANAGRDGTGTLVTLFSAGTIGSRIDKVVIAAITTTTAGMVRLYISDGTNHTLLVEVPVAAVTVSATVPGFTAVVSTVQFPLSIPAGYSLRVSTNNAESFIATAFGGDF